MKKKKFNVIFMCCISISSFMFGYEFPYIQTTAKQYISDVNNYEKNTFNYKKESDLNICKKKGIMNDCWSNAVDDQISIIDKKIIDSFKSSNYKIYVTTSDIATTYSDSKKGSVLGITNFTTKKIYIQASEDGVFDSTIHEIGHWFDEKLGFTSSSKEFKNIYNEEKDVFKTQIYDTEKFSEREMFAEGFFIYYKHRSKLERQCPKLYQFIKTSIDDF